MQRSLPEPADRLSRREFLTDSGLGLARIALASLLAREAGAAGGTGVETDGVPVGCHFAPRAKRVIQVFLTGGVSQVDTFDYKPELWKRHGEPMPGGDSVDTFNGKIGNLMRSPWEFKRFGQTGHYCSSLLPHLADHVDDLTFLHGMTARSANHGPAQLQMNCGFIRNGFPCLGSWLSYAMGREAESLPFFVVLPDTRGIPAGGTANWSSGFLPARNQGTPFRPKGAPVADLTAPTSNLAESQ